MSFPLPNNPLVSVIVPFYNAENFLKEAIESVLQQEYTNWEMILADDGAVDNSPNIAREYAAAYPQKIFYCCHEHRSNKGVSATRNLAIERCRGQLIALLDSDDVWTTTKLQHQVNIFNENPGVGMLCEASMYWYSWNLASHKDEVIKVGYELQGVYAPGSLLKLLYPLGRGAAPCPSGIMMTKDAWKSVGGFEESFNGIYQMYEDQAFLCKIYLQYPVYISQECNNWYRQREGSLVQSVTANGQYGIVRKRYLEYLSEYLQSKNISDPELLKLLHRAYLPYGRGFKNLVKRITNKAARYFMRSS
jgi:glycosyltransferase involved in cell wall biosynthesis